MSNLDNVFPTCPALMSDGRSQTTDYRSHNEVLKIMKGDMTRSYDFREKLQGSGLRDLMQGVRFNMCQVDPSGPVVLSPQINLTIDRTGSYLDAFKPLSSNTFFVAPQYPVKQPTPVPTATPEQPQTPLIFQTTLEAPLPALPML